MGGKGRVSLGVIEDYPEGGYGSGVGFGSEVSSLGVVGCLLARSWVFVRAVWIMWHRSWDVMSASCRGCK